LSADETQGRYSFPGRRENLPPLLIDRRLRLVAIFLGVLPSGEIQKARFRSVDFHSHHGR
jgi:hypothetical protein